jgi:hypothetical protein
MLWVLPPTPHEQITILLVFLSVIFILVGLLGLVAPYLSRGNK